MKDSKKGHAFLLGTFAIIILIFTLRDTALVSALLSAPFWVHVVLVGIVLSGYLAVTSMLEDKKVDEDWIEQEGEVYMNRIKEARESKNLPNE